MVNLIQASDFSTMVLKKNGNVIVDFFSTECPPCEALAPSLDEVESLYAKDVTVYKLYRQENRELAQQLEVKSSPTVLFFKDGNEVGQRLSGTIQLDQLKAALSSSFGLESKVSDQPRKDDLVDVLILGAGPAGLSAAIYTARAGKKTVVLKGKAKSRLEMAHLVENYPGLPPLTGKELLDKLEAQAIGFGAKIITGDALELALGADPKMVTTRSDFFMSKTIILAMGKGQHQQVIENEERFVGMGVSYCATCDGAFYRGKKVIVYGNDEEAVDDALMLKQLGCETTLISYCKPTMCPPEFIELAKSKGIEHIPDARLVSFKGESMVTAVDVQTPDGITTMPTDGVFIIQAVPSQALLKKAGISITSKDCIAVDRDMKSNLPGVFAAGDVTCGGLQIAIATGEGVTAALEALKYIRQRSSLEKN